MQRLRPLALVLVTVAVVTTLPIAGLAGAAGTAAEPGADDRSEGVQRAVQTQQGNASACDYVSLYEETISSIAQIQTAGGLGSGFVYAVDEEAGATYVVTNEHVANESATVGVRLAEGDLHNGTVVGATAYADLAVVRVNATPDGVEALALADETPQPGQRVAALGSPFGLESTITSGIVSGVNRSMPTEAGPLPNTIQTDAPINPGNSGGPLVDCESGEVIGVNRAGGGENIGFAVSAALVERIVPELIETGDYAYPFLGVRTLPITQAIVDANDLTVTEGVYVSGVLGGTPASEALEGADSTETVDGERVPVGGDVVVAIDGQNVSTREDLLSYMLTETQPGDDVELTIVRDGERGTVEVTLGERPLSESTGG